MKHLKLFENFLKIEIDMKDVGKIWDKYNKSIANSDGKKSTINKITAKYKKSIETLGGNVK